MFPPTSSRIINSPKSATAAVHHFNDMLKAYPTGIFHHVCQFSRYNDQAKASIISLRNYCNNQTAPVDELITDWTHIAHLYSNQNLLQLYDRDWSSVDLSDLLNIIGSCASLFAVFEDKQVIGRRKSLQIRGFVFIRCSKSLIETVRNLRYAEKHWNNRKYKVLREEEDLKRAIACVTEFAKKAKLSISTSSYDDLSSSSKTGLSKNWSAAATTYCAQLKRLTSSIRHELNDCKTRPDLMNVLEFLYAARRDLSESLADAPHFNVTDDVSNVASNVATVLKNAEQDAAAIIRELDMRLKKEIPNEWEEQRKQKAEADENNDCITDIPIDDAIMKVYQKLGHVQQGNQAGIVVTSSVAINDVNAIQTLARCPWTCVLDMDTAQKPPLHARIMQTSSSRLQTFDSPTEITLSDWLTAVHSALCYPWISLSAAKSNSKEFREWVVTQNLPLLFKNIFTALQAHQHRKTMHLVVLIADDPNATHPSADSDLERIVETVRSFATQMKTVLTDVSIIINSSLLNVDFTQVNDILAQYTGVDVSVDRLTITQISGLFSLLNNTTQLDHSDGYKIPTANGGTATLENDRYKLVFAPYLDLPYAYIPETYSNPVKTLSVSNIDMEPPKFYIGRAATWADLANSKQLLIERTSLMHNIGAVDRNSTWMIGSIIKNTSVDDICTAIRRVLSIEIADIPLTLNVIDLLHEPCSGGSTIARQILWSLRNEYACGIILQYSNERVAKIAAAVSELADVSQQPVILVVDDKNIDGASSLSGLFDAVNKQRQGGRSRRVAYITTGFSKKS